MTCVGLIGMAGSGKSTVGVLLAKALGYDFVDTDLALQRSEGLRLFEILRDRGPEGFLAAEDRLLRGLALDRTVIATGGSAVSCPQGLAHLKTLGPLVWLDVPFAEIERRVGDISTRGVVLAPGQTLQGLYDQRRPLYRAAADLVIEVDREGLETTVARVVAALVKPGDAPRP